MDAFCAGMWDMAKPRCPETAFKAVMDRNRWPILVPTTILAQQHYNTMNERFSGFPLGLVS